MLLWKKIEKKISNYSAPQKIKGKFFDFLNFLKFSQVNFCTL
ncbi:hypothetical protein MSIBF_A2620001 [groundwater metagenome]|uniref:Uncharacterized protein n=1 Tax=groundwater metagenome TaxID=717931 RepID=A0A098EAZ4_9ZZZZ